MLEYLTIEDLPESLVGLEEVIGLEKVKEIVRLMGGCSIYIPSEKSVLKPFRDKMIRSTFDGDYRKLSREFGISEVQVRNVLKSSDK